MIDIKTWIWTKRGWVKANDLYVGDTVISFDSSVNHCVYDTVSEIQIEHYLGPTLCIKSKSMYQNITPDHEIIYFNSKIKEATRHSIRSVFGQNRKNNTKVLFNRKLNPYILAKNREELEWSAIVAASYAQSKYFLTDLNYIWSLLEDINGYDAINWLDTFFHWNILKRINNGFTKACMLKNREVRDMIYHVAPRAGVGALYEKSGNLSYRNDNMWLMRITRDLDVNVFNSRSWGRNTINDYMFNISTKNGSFLARRSGTFLIASNIGS